ncbi:hypothetical protein RHMOL_Rhmol05G0158200 [Rhododendron molle]|uniref:Uncharacterized protein n=1 Tax=Rhododendron molle TaxID=49168 RepID=A0ACC0NPC3_RHOML|nr:hypothetical protein RHMOL_Rhmol05G0158200 [Rhododendron molle]
MVETRSSRTTMALDPPQMGVDDATKATVAAKAAKATETAKATKAAKAAATAAEKATKATEVAKAATASKTGGDQITPEAFAQIQEQIKTLTQGLQTAMQENADLRKQISEPSILNLRHSRHEEEDHREEHESSEEESRNRKRYGKPPLEKPPHEQEASLKIQDQIEGLMKHIKAQTPATVEELVQNTDSLFTPKVMGLPLLRKFKMPQLETFNGSTNPLDHLERTVSIPLISRTTQTLAELMLRAQKHLNAEAVYARHSHDGFDPQAGPSQVGEFPPPDKKRRESTRKTGGKPKNKKVDSRSSSKRGGGGLPQGRYK